jgi:hypothetical protein
MATDLTRERDVSIDYLRAVVTLMVLAHHSSLACTTFAHFDSQNFSTRQCPCVTWMQRLLLPANLPAGSKFLLVFLGATALSWLTAQTALRIPGVRSAV